MTISCATRADCDANRPQAREAWLARLPIERKIEQLFELEILLKGLACFANPRNHPGPPRRTPVVAQDFREHAALVREALGRIVQTCRVFLAEGDRAFVFQRYLETVLPDDRARTRLARRERSRRTRPSDRSSSCGTR